MFLAMKTTAATVTVREAGGRVVGPISVHGAGGVLKANDRARFEAAIEHATAGRPIGLYEPARGHVRAYEERAAGPTNETRIDLRGATLVAWAS
jgi:hypothetical protein